MTLNVESMKWYGLDYGPKSSRPSNKNQALPIPPIVGLMWSDHGFQINTSCGA